MSTDAGKADLFSRFRHGWRRFWLLLGAFFAILCLASLVPTPGAWSGRRSQWAAPAAIAISALLFIFETQWSYRRGGAITRLQHWILSLVFGTVLVLVAFALGECIFFWDVSRDPQRTAAPI